MLFRSQDAAKSEALAHQVTLDTTLRPFGLQALAQCPDVTPRAERVGECATQLEVELAVAQLLVEDSLLVHEARPAPEVRAGKLSGAQILLLLDQSLCSLSLLEDGERRDGGKGLARRAEV